MKNDPREIIIEVSQKPWLYDASGEGVRKDLLDAGWRGVRQVLFSQLYCFKGTMTDADIERICADVLLDPVVQQVTVRDGGRGRKTRETAIEVWFKPGVTDTVAESAHRAIRDVGIRSVSEIHSGRKYRFSGGVNRKELPGIAMKFLSNDLIEEYFCG